MKQGTITISGPIGEIETEGQVIKGVTLLDVIAQVKAAGEVDEYMVGIGSPGGVIVDGDQIYDYLNSLKQTKPVNTISIGDIGSIATKLFLVGDKRYIRENHKFFIHNPWSGGPGDAKQKALESQALKAEEDRLRSFYQNKIKIDAVGLAALMDNQTEMNADQAVSLEFATEKVKSLAKAMAFINKDNMDNNTVSKKLDNLLSMISKAFDNKPKNIVLDVADGSKVFADTEDAAMLEGVSMFQVDAAMNPTTNPVPDGTVELADGRKVTVAGGKVATVEDAPAAPAAPSSDAAVSQKLDQLLSAISKLAQAQPNVNVKDQINAAIMAFKNDNKEAELERKFEEKLKALRDEIGTTKVPVSGLAGHVTVKETKKSPIQAYLQGKK